MSMHEFTLGSKPDIDSASAKAANLRERAAAVEQAGPARQDQILAAFTNPSWTQLQRVEDYQIGLVADAMANIVFGSNGTDGLTPRIADDIEQGATYLIRRVHPEFVQAAHEQAVETLLISGHFRALASGRERESADLRLLAHWLVTEMWAAFHGVLEGRVPIHPAIYLKASAGAVERGAR